MPETNTMTMSEVRAWLISHLREEHGFDPEEHPPDSEPFVPWSIADLKAAHDLLPHQPSDQ